MAIDLKKLTVQKMLVQRVIARLDGDRLDEPGYFKEAKALVSAGVGGFILFGGDFWKVRQLLPKLLGKPRVPLFIASDMERGAGQQLRGATQFPCQMAVAAATDLVTGSGLGLLEDMADAVAFEAKAAGVNTIFSPVLDVNSNPDNPIICTRAFSDEPEKVSALGEHFVSCYQNSKTPVLACPKHYPGHGDASADSHTSLPAIDKEKENLEDEDMLPFRKAFMAGAEMVMVGHLLVRDIDPLNPATLSSNIIKNYLRTRSRYEGLVVTDALNMGAVCRLHPYRELARLAIKAGSDILLHPAISVDFVSELNQLAAEKGVTKEETYAPAARIRRIKEKYCTPVKLTDAAVRKRMDENSELANVIATRALTLVKADGAFPKLPEVRGNVSHIVLDDDGDQMSGMELRNTLNKRHARLKNLFVGRDDIKALGSEATKRARSNALTVLSIFSRVEAGKGRSGLSPEVLELAKKIVKQSRRSVVVSFGSPYILTGLMDADYVVAAYDPSEPMQRALTRALMGEIFFRGQLPVHL